MIDIFFATCALLPALLYSGYFTYLKIHPENTPLKQSTNTKGRVVSKPISTTKPLLISTCLTIIITVYLLFALRDIKRSDLEELFVVMGLVVIIFAVVGLLGYGYYCRTYGDKKKSKNKNDWIT